MPGKSFGSFECMGRPIKNSSKVAKTSFIYFSLWQVWTIKVKWVGQPEVITKASGIFVV